MTSPTDLKTYLNPTGNITNSGKIPDVIGPDGQPVLFTDPDRITNEATVVDIGASPNSNTGDPIRLAFLKLNNFVEASYILNQYVDSELQDITSGINGGTY